MSDHEKTHPDPVRQAVLLAAIATLVKAYDAGDVGGRHWESTTAHGGYRIRVEIDVPTTLT